VTTWAPWQRSSAIVVRGPQVTGRIARLSHGRSCGVIRTTDGVSVFFHRRDLAGIRYGDLEVGHSVHFQLIDDPISGPRAAQVQIVSKRPAT
jgi:cold shock CspA family protein